MITYRVLADLASTLRQFTPTFPHWIERSGVMIDFKWCIADRHLWVLGYPYLEDNDEPGWLFASWRDHNGELELIDSRRFLTRDEVDLYLAWFEETHDGRHPASDLRA